MFISHSCCQRVFLESIAVSCEQPALISMSVSAPSPTLEATLPKTPSDANCSQMLLFSTFQVNLYTVLWSLPTFDRNMHLRDFAHWTDLISLFSFSFLACRWLLSNRWVIRFLHGLFNAVTPAVLTKAATDFLMGAVTVSCCSNFPA